MNLSSYFTTIDWVVVFVYLSLTTFIGHVMSGKQASIRDFFLGGRSLPWLAVCGSIIATEISALTFIGVPGTVFAVQGDFTYLQWAMGSIMARFAVGYWLVPLYFQQEIYSPYDYMGMRLGASVKRLVTVLFSLGAILGQSVRVLVTALILKVVTGLDIEWCIVVIGVFAICWTWMGGMRTVIWTDVIQFFLFVFGGILALVWVIGGVNGGWKSISELNHKAEVISMEWEGKSKDYTVFQVKGEEEGAPPSRQIAIVREGNEGAWVTGKVVGEGESLAVKVGDNAIPAVLKTRNKMKLWDFRLRDPDTKRWLIYTFWIAIFAMPFQNFTAFGTDQLMAQRLFCCRDASDARKAIVWSGVSQLITVLMLMVSAGLYAWYQQKAITSEEFLLFAEDTNHVFPVWITTALPVGLSGLLVAGAFAAAISSLDSILAALSQTTLSAIYGSEKFAEEQDSKSMVWKSRLMVICWGIALTCFAIVLNIPYQAGEKDLIGFAFRMVSYTYGPILGILMLAIFPVKKSVLGIIIGTVISVILASLFQPDIFNLLKAAGFKNVPEHPIDVIPFPWFFPLNAAITFFFGWVFGQKSTKPSN